MQNTENLKTQLKMIKRRLPQDTAIIKCGLSEKTLAAVKSTTDFIGKSVSAMFYTSKLVLQAIASSDEIDGTVSHEKLVELLSAAFERVYEQDDRGPTQNLRTIPGTTNTEMAQIAQYLLDNEYEISSVQNAGAQKRPAPIVLRAQFVKQQLEQTKTLTANLENREAEIRQLKLASKMKQSELSEMQIRKDLAEKRVSVLQANTVNTEELQRKCDAAMAALKRCEEILMLFLFFCLHIFLPRSKEKVFEESMDHLQKDIESLESERGALREKLKGYGNKKGGDLKASTAFGIYF